ncbi:integral membrane sensor signal transduction histidine kinase [[Leptolyngbya] sp. PCC 7376]|uniref:sensor histidine kinase n=1 Tax=[Leptolyngbya] sp. PCC 7376 TaxID=111781 RepID=UPI00029F397F|nr:ATP-binding protein [[Leptolyngbya] sp. PCC 7376]AFY37591.1 integral membrane sensor signal transduction histidine kinase [[Leptolyngbya] sp. PCC 7376]
MKPIFRQLLLGFGFSLTIVGFGATWINYRIIQRDFARQINIRASSITQSLKLSTEGLIELGYFPLLERAVTNHATLPEVKEVAIVDPNGKIISHSLVTNTNQPFIEIHPTLNGLVETASLTGDTQSQRVKLDGKPVFVEVLPFSNMMFGTDMQRGVAIAILDLEPLEKEARKALIVSSLAIAASILLVLVMLSYLIHRIILSPLSRLNDAVYDSKTSGDFHFNAGELNNEITFLAQTFDEVYQQLATYEELEKEVQQRKEAEVALRESESEERKKAEALSSAIETLKETQIQLIQTEKMSSLGQMVAGLAHEINNPVNFIHNNLVCANQYLNDLIELATLYQQTYEEIPPEIRAKLTDIDFEFIQEDAESLFRSLLNGSGRICELVVSLKNFSRLDQAEQKDVDIHEGIESTLLILKNRLERLKKTSLGPIRLVKNYGELPLVNCYASQLNQVLMNLLLNAIDALNEKAAAIIMITTEHLDNGYLRITIADNGCGIPGDIIDTLFDPFFTTKPVGEGTGLGLSISYKIIVEQHKGQLYCNSEVGVGTNFILEIPCQMNDQKALISATNAAENN